MYHMLTAGIVLGSITPILAEVDDVIPTSSTSPARTGAFCAFQVGDRRVKAGSAVLTRVVFANDSAEVILFRQPFGIEYGTVRVQIMSPNTSSWDDLRVGNSGLGGVAVTRDVELPPGGSLVEYVLVFCGAPEGRSRSTRGPFIFAAPGTYHLRAGVYAADRQIFSASVEMNVTTPDPRVETLIKRLGKNVAPVQEDFDAAHLEDERLQAQLSAASANGCGRETVHALKTNLAGVEGFESLMAFAEASALAGSREPQERDLVIAKMNELRKRQDGNRALWRDLATEVLAYQYAREGDETMVSSLLSSVRHESRWIKRANAALEERKRLRGP